MPPARDQLVVVTVLDEPPVVEHEHPVGAGRGRQAVGDGDRRAALGEVRRAPARCAPRSARRPTRSPRRARARRGRRRRPAAGRRAGAPRRQLLAALADRRHQAVGQRLDPVVEVEAVDDGLHVVERRPRPGEADVGGDRCRRTGTAPATRRPAAARSSSLATSCSGTPPRRISPIVGSAKRAISRPSVVLPDPVAPTSATCWPAGMCAVTWRSTASSTAAASPRVG